MRSRSMLKQVSLATITNHRENTYSRIPHVQTQAKQDAVHYPLK
jgi:hypothetical protein